MAWTFTDLKYGWKIAAGITLAATTIYVASNTRERVNEADIIELVLGTTERCLATQYSTNPVAYYVAPPSFVRSWYSNSYETTNMPGDLVTNWYAVLHTNTFTNIIGWRTDRAMMAELDAKIKALVPYYADTNTVYDGSTNIVMLTVTGLWASLGIGDGVSQFTRVPSSGTNAATYGAYPWQIYPEDLEERYKVLNALKYTIGVSPSVWYNNVELRHGYGYVAGEGVSMDTAKADALTAFNASVTTGSWNDASVWWDYRLSGIGQGTMVLIGKTTTNYPDWRSYSVEIQSARVNYYVRFYPPIYTNAAVLGGTSHGLLFFTGQKYERSFFGSYTNIYTWDANSSGLAGELVETLFDTEDIGVGEPSVSNNSWYGSLSTPTWAADPPEPPYSESCFFQSRSQGNRGWESLFYVGPMHSARAYVEWDFRYCTNKYW